MSVGVHWLRVLKSIADEGTRDGDMWETGLR